MQFSRGMIYMILAAVFFSFMSILVKAAGSNLPPQELVLARSLVIFVVTVIMIKRLKLPLLGENKKFLLLRGIFGFMGLLAFFYTLTRLPITDSVTLQYTSPLFTAMLAHFILKEFSTRRHWAYFFFAFLGILMIIRPGFSFQGIPAIVGLAGAFSSGLAYNTVRYLRLTDHPLNIVLYFAGVSLILSALWVAPTFVMPRGREWLMLLGVGLSAQIAQVLMTKSLHYETAARAMNTSYIGVVFSTILGIIFFMEIPDWRTAVGSAMVIYAIMQIARK